MNLKDIIKKGAEFLAERDAKRADTMRQAGIILADDAAIRANRRNQIRANHEAAVNNIIRTSGVMSDCCGSACLRNYSGETICGECLETCQKVSVK